jgi:hypothetical protein
VRIHWPCRTEEVAMRSLLRWVFRGRRPNEFAATSSERFYREMLAVA